MASPPPEAVRRTAQDGAAELARMGIDPRSLGLDPAPPRAPATTGPPVPAPRPIPSALSRPIGAPPRPPAVPTGPVGPPGPAAGPVESLARIVAPPQPRPEAGWRRLARAVGIGLVEPATAAAIEYERQLVARVRLRRPEPRVVAFLAGKGGVGTTTTAAGVALTLATLRNDTTALVSARAGTGALGERLAGRPAPPVPAMVDGTPEGAPLWVHDRLAVVDGAPWYWRAPRGLLVRLLEQLRGRHPITIVDVGNDLGDSAQEAVQRADQVVIVTSASLDAVAAVQVVLSRIHQVDPFRLGTAVVALTCLGVRQYRRTERRIRAELGIGGPRIVPVGFDPWLAAGDRIDPARMRAATREAYLQLAALVVEPGEGGQQWFSRPPDDQGRSR